MLLQGLSPLLCRCRCDVAFPPLMLLLLLPLLLLRLSPTPFPSPPPPPLLRSPQKPPFLLMLILLLLLPIVMPPLNRRRCFCYSRCCWLLSCYYYCCCDLRNYHDRCRCRLLISHAAADSTASVAFATPADANLSTSALVAVTKIAFHFTSVSRFSADQNALELRS